MMDINTLVVVIYMVVLFIMAIVTASRVHSLEDYAVAGRSYPAWVLYATLCATLVGGGFTIGNAEKVHIYGLIFTVAMGAIAVREILVAFCIAPHMWRFNKAISVGDIMLDAYGMPAKILTGLFAGVLCAGMIGIQLRAMGYIFETFFGMHHQIGILVGAGMVLFYVTLGGFKAVVWTDVFQFFILIIALPLAAFLSVRAAGGFEHIVATIPENRFDLFAHYSPMAFFSVTSYFLIGEALAPPYIQRLLAGNTKEVARAAFWTGLTALPLGWIVSIMALAALSLAPAGEPHQVIPFIIQTVLPVGIAGFVMAAMLAIFMSSADSFLNASAVNLIHDVTKPFFGRSLSNKEELWLTQAFTVCVALAAVIFALSYESLVDGILKIYGLWAPIVLVPLIAAIRGYQGNMSVFFITAGSGIVSSVAWDYFLGNNADISGMFVGTCLAAVVFLVMKARISRQQLAKPH